MTEFGDDITRWRVIVDPTECEIYEMEPDGYGGYQPVRAMAFPTEIARQIAELILSVAQPPLHEPTPTVQIRRTPQQVSPLSAPHSNQEVAL